MIGRAKNVQLESFFEKLKARGYIIHTNWKAGRWKNDGGSVAHYSVTSLSADHRPGIQTFVVIDYGADGFGLYVESPFINIDQDVGLIDHGLYPDND